MNPLSDILATLATPGDQPYSWLAWVDNQLGHAMLGLLICGLLLFAGAPPVLAVAVPVGLALAKEAADLIRQPLAWRWLRDSAKDIFFWAAGALLAAALWTHDAVIAGLVVLAGSIMAVASILPRLAASANNRRRHRQRAGKAPLEER
jgi:hypothetical protein